MNKILKSTATAGQPLVSVIVMVLVLMAMPVQAQNGNDEPEHEMHDHGEMHDHQHHQNQNGHEHHNHGQQRSNELSGPSAEDRELLTGERMYTCAMHPQVRSTDPDGRCPLCGMNLVPVEPEGASDERDHSEGNGETITMGPRALALAGVVIAPVERRTLTAELSLPGLIQVAETRRHTLSARMAGRLDELRVNFTGASVKKGDVVAEIYSPELLGTQEELLQAVRLNAQGSREAARSKLRLLGLAEQDIDAIEQSGEVRERLPLRATAGGVIVERFVSQGDYVQTGQPLFSIADLTQVWAQLEAYESDLSRVQTGEHVHLNLAARPGETFHGEVVFVDPVLNEQSRTAGVRVELANEKGQLKPGMLVTGRVVLTGEPALAIPASAPLLTGKRALVYVREPGESASFSLREVTLGPRAGDAYPVLEGLSEGEDVVSHGAFRLDSERQIRGLSSMMEPDGGGAPAHDHGGGSTDADSSQEGASHEGHDMDSMNQADEHDHKGAQP